MSAYVLASKTKAPFHYDEATLWGDKSGIEIGIITTQLLNRFAVSGTISNMQLLHGSRFDEAVYLPERNYQLMNYVISGGYLVLPRV